MLKPELASSLLSSGTRFGNLVIQNLLGSGGKGFAYLAIHPVLKKPFIVKVLRHHNPDDLYQEARLAARIISQNVVPIVDAGIDNGHPFMVQQYVDGLDLLSVIEAFHGCGRTLPAGIACGILSGVAAGLHKGHQAGVVHRDVKPQNIFLRGDGTAALGDFGMAQDLHDTQQEDWQGGTGGTPNFKPPEQWKGGALDRRADLYALGVTAHLLMTGFLPFQEPDLESLRQAHLEREYVPPVSESPRLAYIFSVIKRLLAKDPSHRPRNAEVVQRQFARMASRTLTFLRLNQVTYRFGDVMVSISRASPSTMATDILVRPLMIPDEPGLFHEILEQAGSATVNALQDTPNKKLGQIVWTTGGHLSCHWLVHAVFVMDGALCLQRCVLAVLLEGEVRHAKHVTFLPLGEKHASEELSVQRMLEAIVTFASWEPVNIREVVICVQDDDEMERMVSHFAHFATNPLESLYRELEAV